MKKTAYKAPYDRVRGKLEPSPILQGARTIDRTYKNAAPTSTRSAFNCSVSGSSQGILMYDRVTPGFREISAKGGIVNNPMSRIDTDFYVYPYDGMEYSSFTKDTGFPNGTVLTDTSTVSNWFPDVGLFPSLSPTNFATWKQMAINKAFASSHQRNVLGFVDLAELGKTKELLLTNLGRLEKLFTGVPLMRKATRLKKWKSNHVAYQYKSKTAIGQLSDASGLWLELQYGAIPTMMSVKGLIKTLTQDLQPVRQTFRSSEHRSDDLTVTRVDNFVGWMTPAVLGTKSYTHNYRYDYTGRAGLITDYHASIRDQLGLTLRDLPTTVYELVPYSFVLDWWLDLGSYIEAATPVKGFNNLASWITEYLVEDQEYHFTFTGGMETNGTTTSTYTPAQCSLYQHSRKVTRTPGISPGLPSIDASFKSWKHAVSAVALVLSRAKSKAVSRI